MPSGSRVPELGSRGEGWVALQLLAIAAILGCRFTGVEQTHVGLEVAGLPGLAAGPGVLGLGLAAGVVLQFVSLYAIEPLIARATGKLPDVSLFSAFTSNWRFLVLSLVVSWTIAAIGEEFTYRGYLMSRTAQVLGSSRRAWTVALVVTSALFGAAHLYQGASGVITTGLTGLILGALFLACGRNLWVPIMAHGANDTIGFLLLFFGRYPGQ